MENNVTIINDFLKTKINFMDIIDGSHYQFKETVFNLMIYSDGIELLKSNYKLKEIQ